MKFSLALSALLAGSTAAQSIVDIALSSPETFSTLTDLVDAADMVEALSTLENITLFAPVNDAFDAIPEEIVANLLTEQWQLHLRNVLAYHVIEALVPASDIVNNGFFNTLMNEVLNFTITDGGGVVVNGVANVTQADITADNGLIHVIDAVLLPSWLSNTIVDRVVNIPEFSILADFATQAGLLDTLSSPGPFTVFAPNNDAFDPLPSVNPSMLADILTYHVVPGIYTSAAITDGLVLTTVQGENITFTVPGGGGPQVNGQAIVAGDILANNGIIHAINGILIPLSATDPDAPTMDPDATMDPEVPGGSAPTMSPMASSASQAFPAAAVMALFAGVMAMAL